MRNAIYRILYDDVAEREGLLCVAEDWGDGYDHYEAERFLFVRFGERSKANPTAAHRILAEALEREARLLERGLAKRTGESYAPTLKRIVAVDPDYSQAVSFALGFWDNLVAAARSGWRTYGGFGRADWIRFARRVAREVRRGREAIDLPLLDFVEVENVETRPKWFRGVFGRRGRIDR
jgi:hypothetical protein